MEQWRWMPQDLGRSHLFVNVPAFEITYVDEGVSKLQERVIVGKPDKPDADLLEKNDHDRAASLLKLPDSIKLEKLRSAQRRGGAVEDEGYRIKKGKREVKSWTVDWNSANLSAYEFVQAGG